jgi:glycosyltransferase involved in cell wall biosynthesis
MRPHLLCIGGDDHDLRIPFILGLRNRGLRVTAAGTCADPAPFERAGIEFHSFRCYRFMNPLADLNGITMFSNLLAAVKPDLVQSFNPKPNLLVPLAARGFRDLVVVRTINGLAWTYSSRSLLALATRPVYRALHRLAARSTDATVFQNQDDKAFFERHGMTGKGSSRLIPGSGVDAASLERARAAGPSAAELREQLGLGSSEVVITVSRMTRLKGIPTLLEAAAMVHAERPGVRFLLVGPRESEGPLAVPQALIDRHAPYVTAIGPRSDVPSLLALADVFAFPTEYREGIPRVLLEAAVAQVPIVATRMPGCVDVVRDGWNGVLVPPREPRLLAAKILDLLRDRETAKAMAERAADFVRRGFDLGLTVDRYVALYSELLEQKHRMADRVSGGERRSKPAPLGPGAKILGEDLPSQSPAAGP